MVPRTHAAAVLALAACMLAGAALADPTIYAGKIGSADIVVELTADPATATAPVAGRYFYRAKGADIPLDAGKLKKGRLTLSEEAPCDASNCKEGSPPVAATWTLSVTDGGKHLKGTWKARKSIGIELTRIGTRAAGDSEEATPAGLYGYSDDTFLDETPITLENSPYDFLRLDMGQREGPPKGWPDAGYRMVSDPRTKFEMPRITDVAGDKSVEAANEIIQKHHWELSRQALTCVSQQYAAFNYGGANFIGEGNGLGDYDGISTEVTALTPKLLSWTESGSVYCGGAHPSDFSDSYIVDIAGGRLLGLDDMLADTVDGKAGPALVGYLKAHRVKSTDRTDFDYEKECGIDDLIADYLAVRLKRDGDALSVVFGLEQLPHAINACAEDLLELPAAEARPFLRPQFAALLQK